jgi:pimeloyl-ACP methyl ester carboxylesterase
MEKQLELEKRYLFTNKDLRRLILPLILEQLLAVLVGMADTVMVASVGESAVSGVSLVDSINILLINIFAALATGGAVVAGQYLGRKDQEKAVEAGEQLLVFVVFAALLIMTLGYLGKNFILDVLFGKIATLEKTPLAIFFAGQGSEASRYLELANRLEGFSAAFVNYRGYGQSGGKPSDKAIFADATAVYDYLVSRGDVDPERVVAIGGSLGTGVATYLASQRDLMGIVLFSPYDRIAGGVTQDMLPFLPTALLFRNKFDVRKYAEATDAFVLAIVGDKDRVITPWRSMLQTANFRNSPSVWTVFIDGGDHYSIYEATETWTAVNDFLSFLLEHSYDSSAEPPIFMML